MPKLLRCITQSLIVFVAWAAKMALWLTQVQIPLSWSLLTYQNYTTGLPSTYPVPQIYKPSEEILGKWALATRWELKAPTTQKCSLGTSQRVLDLDSFFPYFHSKLEKLLLKVNEEILEPRYLLYCTTSGVCTYSPSSNIESCSGTPRQRGGAAFPLSW